MKEAQSLDEYLATLYEGAQLDSRGKFTIDLERRMHTLARHQLRNPENFALGLVSAATLGGAHRFELTALRGGFQLEFDGEAIDSAQLQRLHSVLAKGAVETGDVRLQHLGMALNLVRNLHYSKVTLEVHGSGERLELHRSGFKLVNGVTSRVNHCLTLQGGGWNPSRAVRNRQAVASLLRQRCCFGPPSLQLDKEGLPFNWMQQPLTRLFINGGAPTGSALPQAMLNGELRVAESLRGVILLGESDQLQQTLLIVAGVAYPLPFRQLPKGGCQILIWCNELKTDLTMESLVDDASLRDLLSAIPHWINESQLAILANLYAQGGMDALLEHPDLAVTLWNYRQQLTHSLRDFSIQWSGADLVPFECWPLDEGNLSVASAGRAYRRLRALPVTIAGQPVEGCLDDDSPVLPKPNPHDTLVDMLFPVQREFVFFRGRALPHRLQGQGILCAPLFLQCTPLMFDAQLGLNLRAGGTPGQVWRYLDWTWLDGWEVGATSPLSWVPPGVTLAVQTVSEGPLRLTKDQLLQLLRRLYARGEGDLFLEHWLRALLHWGPLTEVSAIRPNWRHQPMLPTHAGKVIPFAEAQQRGAQNLDISPVNQKLLEKWLATNRNNPLP